MRLYPVLLVLAGLAAHLNGLDGDFLLDDRRWIAGNPHIRSLSDVRAVLSPPKASTVGGRPVVSLTLAGPRIR